MLTLLRDSGAITPLSMVYTPYSQSVCSTQVKTSWCRVYIDQFRRGSSQARNYLPFLLKKEIIFLFSFSFLSERTAMDLTVFFERTATRPFHMILSFSWCHELSLRRNFREFVGGGQVDKLELELDENRP
jgi:hypothetical protein